MNSMRVPPDRTLTVLALDFRVGGQFHFRMGDGVDAWHARLEYREIDPPRRLVYDAAFCDDAMAPRAPPFDADWPVHIRYVVTFDEADGITTLTLRGTPHDATAAQSAVFLANLESMRAGFGAAFDALQKRLADD